MIPLPNDVLLQEAEEGETALDSFARADAWIGRGVRSIWAMMFRTGLINLDFATLRQAFRSRGGKTLFGLGRGEGAEAVSEAIASLGSCPLLALPDFARKADRILVNIVGGTDLTLPKVNEIMTAVTEKYGRDSHVIMGAVIDEELQGQVEVCVLGTTDIGGRVMPRRTAGTSGGRAREVAAIAPAAMVNLRTAGEAKDSVALQEDAARAWQRSQASQDEFSFQGAADNRGHFERTDRNLFEGQDLDVPTYLRRGIRIAVQ